MFTYMKLCNTPKHLIYLYEHLQIMLSEPELRSLKIIGTIHEDILSENTVFLLLLNNNFDHLLKIFPIDFSKILSVYAKFESLCKKPKNKTQNLAS